MEGLVFMLLVLALYMSVGLLVTIPMYIFDKSLEPYIRTNGDRIIFFIVFTSIFPIFILLYLQTGFSILYNRLNKIFKNFKVVRHFNNWWDTPIK